MGRLVNWAALAAVCCASRPKCAPNEVQAPNVLCLRAALHNRRARTHASGTFQAGPSEHAALVAGHRPIDRLRATTLAPAPQHTALATLMQLTCARGTYGRAHNLPIINLLFADPIGRCRWPAAADDLSQSKRQTHRREISEPQIRHWMFTCLASSSQYSAVSLYKRVFRTDPCDAPDLDVNHPTTRGCSRRRIPSMSEPERTIPRKYNTSISSCTVLLVVCTLRTIDIDSRKATSLPSC